jgi:hypothetical protein
MTSGRPELGDPDYDLPAFGREVFGGGLRWPATIFAAVAALFLISIAVGILPADMSWPLRARGTTTTLIVALALVFWSVVAGVNWVARLRRRGGG